MAPSRKDKAVPASSFSFTSFWNNRLKPVLRKAFALQSHPTEESFPELPDVLVWFRALLGLMFGTYAGCYWTGGKSAGLLVLQAVNLISFVPVVYCRLYLGASAGVFNMQILFAGSFNALCLTLLVWIYFFTKANEAGENNLAASLLLHQMSMAGGGGAAASAGGDPFGNGTGAFSAPGVETIVAMDGSSGADAGGGVPGSASVVDEWEF